jgi:hypothetical protein
MAASTENDSKTSFSSTEESEEEMNGGSPSRRMSWMHEPEEVNWLELQNNVYSAGIASVVQQISFEGEPKAKRFTRVAIALAVVVLAIGLQVFLVMKVKSLVCAKSVHAIRDIYSEYEDHMYSKTYLTVNGKNRGSGPEFFLPENFDTLDEDFKADVCQFPLTQPDFLFAILFMWTLTICAELRRCCMWAYRFLIITATDREDWVHLTHAENAEKHGLEEGQIGLTKLSMTIKVAIFLLFTVQGSTALFLLWVGCRWLMATPSFSDLILNGLALSFIVEIKDMLYEDLLPKLFQKETEVIRVRTEDFKQTWGTLMIPVLWAVVAALWVVLYMFYFQAVLPDYRWDVKGPCFEFLMQMTAV